MVIKISSFALLVRGRLVGGDVGFVAMVVVVIVDGCGLRDTQWCAAKIPLIPNPKCTPPVKIF